MKEPWVLPWFSVTLFEVWKFVSTQPGPAVPIPPRFLAPQARQLEAAHQRSEELEHLLRTAQAQVDTLSGREIVGGKLR